jgi:hypothetical protein
MSLPAAEAAALGAAASHPMPAGWNGIHFLAALYLAFGSQRAFDVTQAIGTAVRNPVTGFSGHVGAGMGVYAYFSGFIANSDTRGFRAELADPQPSNPQTGHFFSYVVWALDGIDDMEWQLALGHELYPDSGEADQFTQQWQAGLWDAGALRSIVVALPQDASVNLNFAALDREFRSHGWDARMVPFQPVGEGYSDEAHALSWYDAHPYTGNSIEDLRCTVAGFQFGRLIRSGRFADATAAARWLEHNVLDGSLRELDFTPAAP